MKVKVVCMSVIVFLAAGLCRVAAAGEAAEAVDLTKPDPAKAAEELQIKALIEKLGAADTVQREDAEKSLAAFGAAAGPLLKAAVTSPLPEISARAKRLVGRLAGVGVRVNSYSDILPADAVFFLEFADTQGSLKRLNQTPIGRFWETPPMRKTIQGHRKDMLPTELQVLDAMQALSKIATGRTALTVAGPETIQPEEIDPPIVYLLESNNPQAAEAQVRQIFVGMGDPIKSKRINKQFTIEEQANANTHFSQDRIVHALTERAIDSILDSLLKPPAKTLSPVLADLRAQRPNADCIWRLSSAGFKNFVDALQIIDQEQLDTLAAAGFIEGSSIDGAVTFNAAGAEELTRLQLGGGAKNKGVLGILQRLNPVTPAAGPQASDMMPYQAAMVVTINADVSKNSAELAASLTALDKFFGKIDPVAPVPDAEKLNDPTKKPDGGLSPAAQALDAGGGKIGVAPKDPKAKPKEPERTTPHIERLEKSGIQLDKLLAQAQGPMCVALFPEQVDVTRVSQANAVNPPADPDHVPMSAVFAMCVKDSAPLEEQLAKALRGVKLAHKKLDMNGGTLYIDADTDEDDSPAFWVSGHYFAYGTSRDVLELASAAVLNAKGNQRIDARPEYRKLAAQRDPAALVDVFADSTLFLDMPYKMAQLGWQEQLNPWPDFAMAAQFLKDNFIHLSVKQIPGGLQITSQTPLSLLGMIEAIRKPLSEAQLLNF